VSGKRSNLASNRTRPGLAGVFRPVGEINRSAVSTASSRAAEAHRPQTPPPVEKRKFAPDPQRRLMIAKIQIAKKDLDFDDGDYRALLNRVTGKTSSTKMSFAELGQVLDEFARLGWAPATSTRKPKPADHPAAKKARAMWISLSLLGVIRQPSEAALEAFARRQMGVERLQWADQAQVYKLIEALKRIAERHGWDQNTAGLADPIWTLKYRLCAAILRRLIAAGAVSASATMATMLAERLELNERVQQVTERDLEQLAAVLGRARAQPAANEHYED
jgi:phage gp16-like protein